jgi:flagellar hook-length control protein FliK
MKIDDSQPVDDPSINTDDMESDDVDAQSTQPDDQPSPFSQVLAKKKAQERDSASTRPEKKGEESRLASPGFVRPDEFRNVAGPVGGLESKRAVALPADLQQLVREISVVMNKSGQQQVQIEMNSNVLQGLHIRIERQEGALAIQFQTDSQQVSSLISRNLDSLSQSLSNLGESGVDIRVTSPKEASKGLDNKYRGDQGGGRGQGGYGGGRR